jgi:hypothetical protein
MTQSRLAAVTLSILVASCGGGKKSGEDADADLDTTGDTATDHVTDGRCTRDEDCDNGLYCDGEETCGTDGTCQPGTDVECDDFNPCTTGRCEESSEGCVYDSLDGDGDGYVAVRAPTGEECGGDDCDDTLDDWHPGADEDECDFLDKDCDGDDSEHIDDDGDGWIDEVCDGVITDPGAYDGLGDCNDEASDVYPGAPEGCDGTVDNDCDGDDREIDTDADHDTYPPPSCATGGVEEDCDDSDATVYPGAPEVCDMVDHDCDGSILDSPGIDDDGDTVPDATCGGNDCDDSDATVHGAFVATPWPGDSDVGEAAEVCDTVDQDCDSLILDAPGADDDGDTHLDGTCGGDDCDDSDATIHPGVVPACETADRDCNGHPDNDNDGDGYVRSSCSGGNDCDDTSTAYHPGATLSCDTEDHDCNGRADRDNDADGHVRSTCSGGDDCDDADATVHPGASRGCGDDHDCDTVLDDDSDSDTYVWDACSGGTDCNDSDATVHPFAAEVCDAIDQDCDGDLLDAVGADDDSDGYLDSTCSGDDCDDSTDRYHPNGGGIDPPEPDACTADDYDCDTVPDALGAPAPHLVQSSEVAGMELAWSGSEYGVVYQKYNTTDTDILFARLDDDGVAVAGSEIWITSTTTDAQGPDIEWGSSRWGLVWYDPSGVYAKTLASNGTDPQPPTGGTSLGGAGCDSPAIAYDGTTFGVVWECSNTAIRFVPIDRGTASPTETAIDLQDVAGTTHMYPDIAWASSRYGVVWVVMEPSTNREIYLDVVNPVGMMDTTEIRVSSAGADRATTPKISGGTVNVSGSGPGFGVVWRQSMGANAINGAVYKLGTGASAPAVLASAPRLDPKIEWNGTRFGIVFYNTSVPVWVEFMQMDGSGSAAGTILRINPTVTSTETMPTLAWESGRFAALWNRLTPGSDSYFTFLWCTY